MSPTQRTLDYYRKLGYHADVTERWLSHARVRKDLFGFIDILAMDANGLIGAQATTHGNVSARKRKILTECQEEAEIWLRHARILVIGWKKHKAPVHRLWWRPTIYEITACDIDLMNASLVRL